MKLRKKLIGFLFLSMFSASLLKPVLVEAQTNGNNNNTNSITPPPSSGSGVGQNTGPYTNPGTNTSTSGGGIGPVSSDPGGPTDPPPDVNVPIDGGLTILIALGLVHGYVLSKKRRKLTPIFIAKDKS